MLYFNVVVYGVTLFLCTDVKTKTLLITFVIQELLQFLF